MALSEARDFSVAGEDGALVAILDDLVILQLPKQELSFFSFMGSNAEELRVYSLVWVCGIEPCE